MEKQIFTWAVTGTFHGALISTETEGDARRTFHALYNGESIITVKKYQASIWCF